MKGLFISLFFLALLSGCSTKPPLPSEGVNTTLTSEQALAGGDKLKGTRVLWGGVIVDSSNQKRTTRLEVLAYPLNDKQRPKTNKMAGTRFIAYQPGYLETVDYAPGREVSVVGTLGETEMGKLGEREHRYPTVNVEQLHLWPTESQEGETRTRVHFGIGVILQN